MMLRTRLCTAAILLIALCSDLAAQEQWDVEGSATGDTLPLEFVATEGTWISVDVSRDGASIVFDLLGHLYEMPFTGGDARALTQGRSWNMYPRYSPDGSSIAFTSDAGGMSNIWLLDRASAQKKRLTAEPSPVFRASWSADGRVLYAAAMADGRISKGVQVGLDGTLQELVNGGRDLAPLSQLNEDSSRARIVFEHHDQRLYPRIDYYAVKNSRARIKAYDKRSGGTTTLIERPGGAFNPAVSPDGKLLAYLNRHDQTMRLIIRELGEQRERVLASLPDRDRQDRALHYDGAYPGMAWHPNGRELVLSFGGGIHVVDAVTGSLRQVPFRAPVNRQVDRALHFPTPVPQGESRSRIHRWAKRTEQGILYETLGDLYLKSGNKLRNLTASPAHETSPVLDSRTGTLYYASWTDDELGAVFSRKLSGGKPVRLSSRPAQYGALALAPDGGTLVFLRGSEYLASGLLKLDTEWQFEMVAVGADRRERRLADVRWAPGYQVPGQTPIITIDSAGFVYFAEFEGDTLLLQRISLHGGDKTTLYRLPHAVYAVVSPDARWIVFQQYHRSYLLPFEYKGTVLEASGDHPQARRVDARDGFFLSWRDARTLQWTRGKEFLEKSVSDVLADGKAASSTDIFVPFRVATPASTIALRGVRVITMRTPDEVLEDATVLIEGSRVRAVGRNVAIPQGARIFDLPGHTVMPGIIDVHAHMDRWPSTLSISRPLHNFEQRSWWFSAVLAHGVTTLYQVAGSTIDDFWVSDMSMKGDIVGPRFFSTGWPMFQSRPSSWWRPIQSLDDAREHASLNKEHGATALKDHINLSRAVRHQIVTAGKELGLNVLGDPMGHGETYSSLSRVVDGVTEKVHGAGLTFIYDDVVRMFAATGTGVTPTLVVMQDGPWGEFIFTRTERVWENEKLLRFICKQDLLEFRRGAYAWPDDYLPQHGEKLRKLFDAGVLVNLGTHGWMPGLDAHWEMELFTLAGFTPLQAIQIATRNPARHHRMDDLGSIEAGKLADLVVLKADPLKNIRNTRDVHMVMKNGVLYSGADLSRVFPDPQPAGQMYFRGCNAPADQRPK